MKLAVYSIAKDEEKFVSRWRESARDADHLIILDTGSSDGTVQAAVDYGVTVVSEVFDPWRFDTARNRALDLVPDDVDMCIALDMDEVLVDGWREHLERAFADGVTRPRYQYTWSWNGGRPGLQYGGDKIHARHGYTWKHPVHEVIVPCETFRERQGWYGLEIHHHPDSSKSRSHYLPLLELAVREDPSDDRNSHYLAREYFYAGRLDEAAAEFQRHLNLPSSVWKPERAASMRFLAKCEPDHAWWWLSSATLECPDRREPWIDLALLDYANEEWEDCLRSAMTALRITVKPLEYLCEEKAWGSLPHDLAAISAYNLGLFHEAKFHGVEALKIDPYDQRLTDNVKFYLGALT